MMTLDEVIDSLVMARQEAGVDGPVRMAVEHDGEINHYAVFEVAAVDYGGGVTMVLQRGQGDAVATEAIPDYRSK